MAEDNLFCLIAHAGSKQQNVCRLKDIYSIGNDKKNYTKQSTLKILRETKNGTSRTLRVYDENERGIAVVVLDYSDSEEFLLEKMKKGAGRIPKRMSTSPLIKKLPREVRFREMKMKARKEAKIQNKQFKRDIHGLKNRLAANIIEEQNRGSMEDGKKSAQSEFSEDTALPPRKSFGISSRISESSQQTALPSKRSKIALSKSGDDALREGLTFKGKERTSNRYGLSHLSDEEEKQSNESAHKCSTKDTCISEGKSSQKESEDSGTDSDKEFPQDTALPPRKSSGISSRISESSQQTALSSKRSKIALSKSGDDALREGLTFKGKERTSNRYGLSHLSDEEEKQSNESAHKCSTKDTCISEGKSSQKESEDSGTDSDKEFPQDTALPPRKSSGISSRISESSQQTALSSKRSKIALSKSGDDALREGLTFKGKERTSNRYGLSHLSDEEEKQSNESAHKCSTKDTCISEGKSSQKESEDSGTDSDKEFPQDTALPPRKSSGISSRISESSQQTALSSKRSKIALSKSGDDALREGLTFKGKERTSNRYGLSHLSDEEEKQSNESAHKCSTKDTCISEGKSSQKESEDSGTDSDKEFPQDTALPPRKSSGISSRISESSQQTALSSKRSKIALSKSGDDALREGLTFKGKERTSNRYGLSHLSDEEEKQSNESAHKCSTKDTCISEGKSSQKESEDSGTDSDKEFPQDTALPPQKSSGISSRISESSQQTALSSKRSKIALSKSGDDALREGLTFKGKERTSNRYGLSHLSDEEEKQSNESAHKCSTKDTCISEGKSSQKESEDSGTDSDKEFPQDTALPPRKSSGISSRISESSQQTALSSKRSKIALSKSGDDALREGLTFKGKERTSNRYGLSHLSDEEEKQSNESAHKCSTKDTCISEGKSSQKESEDSGTDSDKEFPQDTALPPRKSSGISSRISESSQQTALSSKRSKIALSKSGDDALREGLTFKGKERTSNRYGLSHLSDEEEKQSNESAHKCSTKDTCISEGKSSQKESEDSGTDSDKEFPQDTALPPRKSSGISSRISESSQQTALSSKRSKIALSKSGDDALREGLTFKGKERTSNRYGLSHLSDEEEKQSNESAHKCSTKDTCISEGKSSQKESEDSGTDSDKEFPQDTASSTVPVESNIHGKNKVVMRKSSQTSKLSASSCKPKFPTVLSSVPFKKKLKIMKEVNGVDRVMGEKKSKESSKLDIDKKVHKDWKKKLKNIKHCLLNAVNEVFGDTKGNLPMDRLMREKFPMSADGKEICVNKSFFMTISGFQSTCRASTMRKRLNHIIEEYWDKDDFQNLYLRKCKTRPNAIIVDNDVDIPMITAIMDRINKYVPLQSNDSVNWELRIREWISSQLRSRRNCDQKPQKQ